MKRVAAILALLLVVTIAALAQDASESDSDNGFLINLLENQLSAPGRQIRLSGVSGALSSRARITRITISDDKGPWLEVDNAQIDWSRLALLRGRVNIDRLSADRVAWLRRAETPPPARTLPQAETQPFALPELPVSIQVRELAVGTLSFAEDVFGQAAELGVTGNVSLAGGTLDSALDIKRQDGPGGELTLKAAFSNQTRQLDVDVALHEPQGGVVATLLRIEGAPAIDLEVQGSGPLDNVDVNFSLDADQLRIAQGTVALRARDDGLGFDVDFGGGLSPLVPQQFRDFFAGQSTVKVTGVRKSAGGLRIDQLTLAGAVLHLDGGLETGNDGFLRSLALTGSLGDPAGPAVLLPVPGGRTSLNSAELYVDFGSGSRWSGFVALDRLRSADIEMEDVTLKLGGLAQNLEDASKRNVTIDVEGLATGVWAPDPEVARALGTRIDLFADAALAPGGPLTLHQFQVSGNGLSIFAAGELRNLVFTGRSAVRVADMAVFSGLADRALAGAVDLRATGSVTPLSGGFDLTFEGGGDDLALGDARLDPLLRGRTTLSGRAVRDEAGIRTENLALANPQITFASNGQISSKTTDIGFEASLADLALVDPRLAGAVTARGHAQGDGQPITVSLAAEIPRGKLMDRDLTNARIGFDGAVNGTDVNGIDVTGTLSGAGGLDGLVLSLAGDLAITGQDRSLRGFELAVGPNRLTGDVAQSGTEPVVGRMTLAAPDIAPLAALALVEASGALNADLTLDKAEVGQGVAVRASAKNVEVAGTRVGQLDLDARIADALGLPLIDGQLTGADLLVGGVEVNEVHATASQVDPMKMRFAADARLAVGTLADLSGELARVDGGFAATLDTLRLRQKDVTATLTAPATVTMRGSAIELTPLALDFGQGRLTAQGRLDESFDLDLAIESLPLALANAIRPDLGLAGTVNGTARVTGPRAQPDVEFNLDAEGMASAITRGAGLPPVSLRATGRTADGRLNLDAAVSSPSGLATTAKGSVPLGAGNLDVAIDLQAFPLPLVDRITGNRGLRGTVTGTGHATGPLADPVVSFDLRGEGISATVLSSNGVPALNFTAAGEYRRMALRLSSARVTGAGGLELTGSGTIPFTGPGLDASLSGSAPLSLANPFLASRTAEATGLVRIDARARGSLAAPDLSGRLTLADGTLIDPETNLRLQGMTLAASLGGNAVTIESFRANVVTGGNVTAEGRVGLGRGFPADVRVRLNNVRYTDGTFVSTQLAGDLALTGPLVGGGGMLRGSVDLGRTEISVSEGLGASSQVVDQIEHYRPPPAVAQTLARARVGVERQQSAPSGPGIGLDVRIRAPSQIFVRGRGLDVELGGELTVQGTTSSIAPVGQFDLRRGRLVVLGQRIEFDEGRLQLIGNLDPEIYFVARTQSGDVTAIVTVEGRVSAPKITFSSEPALPQDEVLARVLFNRTSQDLSAFQLAQLAAAAAELAGGGSGPGLLGELRGATGLDDLDIITEESGATAVRAGKYVSRNVYVDVQSDTQGISKAEINLNVTEQLTARGSVASDGNTTMGLFFERDF